MGAHDGRVVVVTGAASGIGRAVVERIRAEGGSVVAVDRAAKALEWCRALDGVAILVGDVTDAALNDAAVALAVETFGRLDAIVLNAGIATGGDLMTLPMEELDQVLDVNVKAVVLGMIERGGDVMTRVIPGRDWHSVNRAMLPNVKAGSTVYTDEAPVFKSLPNLGYEHEAVNHSIKEWVRGDVHTNSIEAFWSHLKRSISGTYVSVSKKHLQTYLREFEFRYNLRKHPHLMIEALLLSFPRA